MGQGLVQQPLDAQTRLGASKIVAPNKRVSPDSVFSDPVWQMSALVTTPGIGSFQKQWDFRLVPGFPLGFALTLAEYAFGRLYTPVDTQDREATWLTVHNDLTALKGFAQYCETQGLIGFHEVDQALCESYLRTLKFSDVPEILKSDERIRYVFRVVYRLWEYRSAVGNSIPSMPFGKPFGKVFKKPSGIRSENATPVIPEPVFAALMSPALDYVLTYSRTIIAAWQRLQEAWDVEIAPLALSDSGKLLRLKMVAKIVTAHYPAHWRAEGWSSYGDVYDELQQLRVAATLVILAFSGIRISELLALEAGCDVTEKGDDGRIRHYINTLVHKHREKGSRDTWVVVDEVVKAIKILEVLTERLRTGSKDDRLFAIDSGLNLFSVQNDFAEAKVGEITSYAVIVQIEAFSMHCGKVLNRPIPEWADEDNATVRWKFNTRQFRRTLARHIARQPFGVIAGMLQYKHVEVTVFEGYAGSEPEWNKLLEQEKVLASVDVLEEVAMDLSNGELAGDFGIKLKEEFAAEFRGRAEDFPPSQIAKWLANSNKALFVGKFNFCFFDPAKAQCTQGVKSDKPILNFCQPEICSNSCVGKRHIPKWEAQLKQAEELAVHPKASQSQRELLLREVECLRAVVTSCGK